MIPFNEYLECVNCGHVAPIEDFEIENGQSYPPETWIEYNCPSCGDSESTQEISEEEYLKIVNQK